MAVCENLLTISQDEQWGRSGGSFRRWLLVIVIAEIHLQDNVPQSYRITTQSYDVVADYIINQPNISKFELTCSSSVQPLSRQNETCHCLSLPFITEFIKAIVAMVMNSQGFYGNRIHPKTKNTLIIILTRNLPRNYQLGSLSWID